MCVDDVSERPRSQTAGSEPHRAELTHYFNDQSAEYMMIATSAARKSLMMEDFSVGSFVGFKAALIIAFILTVGLIKCDMKGVARGYGPEKNYHPVLAVPLSSAELFSLHLFSLFLVPFV